MSDLELAERVGEEELANAPPYSRRVEAKRGWTMADVREYEIEDVGFVEDGVIPPGVSLFVGGPKMGKSQKAEHTACHISETKPVCYFAFEYNGTLLAKRFQAYSHLPATNLKLWNQYDLLDSGQEPIEFIKDRISEHSPYMFVLDTIATVKRQNRGSYQEEYSALQEIKVVADQANSHAVLIHHSRKAGESEVDNPRELVLGSQALAGVPDNVIVLDRHDGCTRIRGWGRLIEDFETLLKFDAGEYLPVSEDRVFEDVMRRNSPTGAKILFALRDGCKTQKELAHRCGLSASQVYNVCVRYRKEGLIKRPDRKGGVWTYIGPAK